MNRFTDIDVTSKRLPAVYGYQNQQLVSIEKALEPIEPQINDLKVYIKTAKKYCHFPSEHGLTRDESAAVYIYTMECDETSLYRLLNNALRDANRQNIKIWFPYLKLFDTALDKLPTITGDVWRGVPLFIGNSFTGNQVLTWWTVNSCSSSVNIIKNFLGNNESTLFLIEIINGKKVSGYTAYEGEDEVILKIGTQFRVKSDSLEQSNQSHIVHLVELDDNDDDDELVISPMKNLSVTSNSGASTSANRVPTQVTDNDQEHKLCPFANKGTCRYKDNQCRYRHKKCQNYDSCSQDKCLLAHAPRSPSQPSTGNRKECKSGIECFNPDCKFRHPEGWSACDDGTQCINYDCISNHAYGRKQKCRDGKQCKNKLCKFLHPNNDTEQSGIKDVKYEDGKLQLSENS
ncbi:unnamed protein product [Adineta steineri]|uniref:NAD(P)(+)--arginine ADP-ribosyltransferase n=1 Tax=Adineta steineri TaxID=433720 RepID=A0A819ANX8_9BILA|nr:unnamed protein product [Adineta steineri]CAF3780308.1 unnamed protein product [Adineta steineri]